MKTRFAIAALFFLFYSFANAQEKPRKWTVRANTGTFIYITNASIERALGKKHSVSLLPSYAYFRSNQFVYKNYGIGLEYRYYALKKSIAPKGWYITPGISFDKGKAVTETNNKQTDVSGFTTHLMVGHQWVFKKGFTIDANLGVQYIKLHVTSIAYAYDEYPDIPILPGVGVGIGYSF